VLFILSYIIQLGGLIFATDISGAFGGF